MASDLSMARCGGESPQPAGILTRTVVSTPVVQWILHARIRQRWLNDVVFVGEDAVHVKNVGVGGHLEHVATKCDFDTKIRAAEVLSLDPEPAVDDWFGKQESLGTPITERCLPHDVLVLTLATHDVLFLCLVTERDGTSRFEQQVRPMPIFDNCLTQPGEHLTVDSQSRAIAVASHEREVVLYSIKKRPQIEQEILTERGKWCPVSAERPIQINGAIQHMEFLIPSTDDEDHIILLLIVLDDLVTKAIRVDWYCGSDLHHAEIHPGLPLDSARTISNLLVPLRDAAFMLVSGSQGRIWRDLLSGSPNATILAPFDAKAMHSGSSPRQPIWASWCRPQRSQTVRRGNDYFYLVREDGLVYLIHVTSPASVTSSPAGHFGCHVDTAFASLGSDSEPDILAVAGSESNGMIMSIGSWSTRGRPVQLDWADSMRMELIETVPNWASVRDMITVPARNTHGRPGFSSTGRSTILVTCGREPYGSITELRKGREARISLFSDEIGDGLLQSVTNVWAVPLVEDGSVLIFLSLPSATALLHISTRDESAQLIGADQCTALDLSRPTLAAASTTDGQRIFQVTTGMITATSGLEGNFEDTSQQVRDADCTILKAAILSEPARIVTVEKRFQDFVLCCNHFSTEDDGETNASQIAMLQLPNEPTAVAVATSGGTIVVAVAFVDGSLRVFDVSRMDSIEHIGASSLPTFEGASSICDHLILIQSPAGTDLLAVAGLRDGRLHCQDINASSGSSSVAIGDSHTLDFGQSTVKVVTLPRQPNVACAMSGVDTCLLTWDGTDARSLHIESIWLTDKDRPYLTQGATTALTRFPAAEHLASGERADEHIFISGNEFIIAAIQPGIETVSRHITVSGTPNRLLYAERERCLIAASLKTGIRSFPTSGRPEVKRQIWPVIDFIPSRSNEPLATYALEPGERVYALLEWTYTDSEDRTYSFTLVGGSYMRRDGTVGGRIHFLKTNKDRTEVVEKRPIKFDAMVCALARYDERTLVVCYGSKVTLWRYHEQSKKWDELCHPFELASSGVFITVQALQIHISTARDSLVTLRLDLTNGNTPTLIPISTGPQVEASISHLNLPDSTTLLTTKSSKVTGLTAPSNTTTTTTLSRATTSLFTAHLPRSLIRIRAANLRPKWKPPPTPGVLEDNLIAASPDGALVGLAILDETLWRRLAWLQHLCLTDSHISPRTSRSLRLRGREERAHPIGLSGSGSEMLLPSPPSRSRGPGTEEGERHIDGDMLARILERFGVEGLLRQAAERNDAVGEWMRGHLEEELEFVEEVEGILKVVLDLWV